MYLYDAYWRFKIYLRSDENMFINSQVGLLSPEKLANSAVPADGLSQASGSADGIIWSIGEVFGGLIGAAVSTPGEKGLFICASCADATSRSWYAKNWKMG